MPAPKGNQFWKMVENPTGRPRKFESKEKLWEVAESYFKWVEDNPLWEGKAFSYQGVTTVEKIPKMRAMTIEAFCLFAGVTMETLNQYEKNSDYKEFSAVVTRIKDIIRDQKFSGAAAELLNPNIIARDLGLSEKSQQDITTGGKPLNNWVVQPVKTKDE